VWGPKPAPSAPRKFH